MILTEQRDMFFETAYNGYKQAQSTPLLLAGDTQPYSAYDPEERPKNLTNFANPLFPLP
jgi:hypothetical protein